jgi:predicted amidophosphoribosyltransferase
MTESEEIEKEETSGTDNALCKGCDADAPLDEIGLCADCAAKLDRDFIRQREWDYSVSAFRLTTPKREELRRYVIKKHGPQLELIVAEKQPRRRRRRRPNKKERDSKTETPETQTV